MQEIEQLILDGNYEQVLDSSLTWNDKQKRAVHKWLKNLWKTEQGFGRFSGSDFTGERGAYWMCVVIASVATARDAKEALDIPPPVSMLFYELADIEMPAKAALIKAIARCGRDWVAAYVAMAASDKPKNRPMYPEVILALVDGFGLPVPLDPVFVDLWCKRFYLLDSRFYDERADLSRLRRALPKLKMTMAEDGKQQAEVSEVIAQSPFEAIQLVTGLPALMSALFARKDAILGMLAVHPTAAELEELPRIIAELIATGALDRQVVVNDAITALTRADSVSAQRLQARLLAAAAPEPEQIAAQMDSLHGLLASGHGSVAEVAQALLRQLDEVQALDGELFSSACQIIFARKEKGRRDEQFAWAVHRLTQQPAQSAATMRGLMGALMVDDFSFQKKVIQKIAEHWHLIAATERVPLFELFAASEEGMDAGLFATLAKDIGGGSGVVAEQPVSVLSVVPPVASVDMIESRPLSPFVSAHADIASLREVLAEYMSTRSVHATEQLIELAFQLIKSDRDAVRHAMLDFVKQYPVENSDFAMLIADAAFRVLRDEDLRKRCDRLLVYHGRDRIPLTYPWDPENYWANRMPVVAVVTYMRFAEIVLALQVGWDYPLLSKPSYEHGSIDAADFLERVRALPSAKQQVKKMDLLVALMRTQQPSPAEILALRKIGSPPAVIAANFFSAGGMGQMTTTWHIVPVDPLARERRLDTGWINRFQPEVCVSLHPMQTLPEIEDIPVRWAAGFTPETAPDVWQFSLDENDLISIMPNNGEILAALHLWGFRKAVGTGMHGTDGGKATALTLPRFIAARGPAGPAMHLAILYVLSADDAQARIVGSDCLLELIAQQRYDSVLASQLVAATIACGSVKLGRLAGSLGQVVEAGAGLQLWPMVRAALSAALEKTPVPAGLADLLALATRIVTSQGIKEGFTALEQVAEKKGSSKMLTEARRLVDVLGK